MEKNGKEYYMAQFCANNGDFNQIIDEIVVPIAQKEATKKGIEIFIKMMERRAKQKTQSIFRGRLPKFLKARGINMLEIEEESFCLDENVDIEVEY